MCVCSQRDNFYFFIFFNHKILEMREPIYFEILRIKSIHNIIKEYASFFLLSL